MAYNLKVEIELYQHEWHSEGMGSQREINNLTKVALGVGGTFWARNILARHFDADAPTIYNYPRYSPEYLQRKQNVGPKVKQPYTGVEYPSTKPPQVLVWTHELKTYVLSGIESRIVSGIKTVAQGKNTGKVMVKVGYPHPINAKWGSKDKSVDGEARSGQGLDQGVLVRMNREDIYRVAIVTGKEMGNQMANARLVRSTTTI
jgi:hypothetical protein